MKQNKNYVFRFYFLILVLLLCFCVLVWRLLDLGIKQRLFLQNQSNARVSRVVDIPAYRGMIVDRNGEPLAVSTPVDSVWINPQLFLADTQQLNQLAKLLGVSPSSLKTKIDKRHSQWFVYLKRHISPEVGNQIKELNISGLFLQREYQRYYPEGEITAHILGFTNVDDKGIDGLELAYDAWLRGVPGKMKVIKDRLGHIVEIVSTLSNPQEGHNLVLSIDHRIQYLAYCELKKTVQKYNADSGSVIVLDPKTGEILAMVNQPSYNPNDRINIQSTQYRNRAVTDLFEPGSTIKTFSIASALISGKYFPNTQIDTNPGRYVVSGKVITDDNVNHGMLTVTGVLQKSSNIGIAKITLGLPPQNLVRLLHSVGFAERTASGFPGEASGEMVDMRVWRPFVLATLSFGYAISVTPLQLTCAYAVIANGGMRIQPTFLKVTQPTIGNRVMPAKVAQQLLLMLKSVVQTGGTAIRAQIPGYQVAGKTGTARVATQHGYDKSQHFSTFVGIAPVSNPRLIIIVVIKNPQGQDFGGLVAAPTFAVIMGESLRFLGVQPDDIIL